ncbi:MAG TPA: energy-coupling factor ABC transporter permease [Burkholderiales bacterium]|jgi:uncharacterized membrane protein|nr:energy-coupling factor ABC transporter permease [Burkholderiales bacterium]
MPHALVTLELALVSTAISIALFFRPWDVLRASALRAPWFAALVILPLLWAAQSLLPPDFPAALSGACLLVLMFGWPLAIVTLCAVAAAGAWLGGGDLARALELAAWNGAVPASVALAIGMAMRRWLPKHLFVYILGRGFLGTAAATVAAATLRVWSGHSAADGAGPAILTAAWLIAWGEAFLTGALTAIFVAFRPQWLLTYSDARYLPPSVR